MCAMQKLPKKFTTYNQLTNYSIGTQVASYILINRFWDGESEDKMTIPTEKIKAEFLLTAAGTEKSHMLKNT